MSRIPAHTVDDAPEASRALLQHAIQFSPTGRPLNLHAQMAHSPAVLVAYSAIRQATAEHGTVGPKVSSALMLATATTVGNDYVVAITSRLAGRLGWAVDEVAALRSGNSVGNHTIDVLTDLIREAAANAGTHLEGRAGRGLDRSAAGRGIRVSGPDRLHRILPELRANRDGCLKEDCVTEPTDE